MTAENNLTGYPSIDKPWLKYYSEEAINAKVPECTIYEYLWENNKAHLEEVALEYFGRKVTYKKLFENINKVAAAFEAMGIEKGDIVTIQSLSLPQVTYMIYALSKLGAIANLIYATATFKEVEENLIETKSKVYVVIDSIYKSYNTVMSTAYLKKIVTLAIDDEMSVMIKVLYKMKNKSIKNENDVLTWKRFLLFARKDSVNVSGVGSDIVAMVYTGGTTGKSKGVMLSNYNLNVGALQYLHLGFERGKTFLSVLPPFIAFGITVTMHMPLLYGLKVVLGVSKDPSEISGFVEKCKPNYIICGTTQAEKMVNALGEKYIDLSSLICLSVGGDVLTSKLEEKINSFLQNHNSKIKVAQGYAMSETSASTAASTYTTDNVVFKKGTIGVPMVYTNIKLVDTETGEERRYGEQGEICINAPCIMQGYYKNEEETNNILRKHSDGEIWVHTGDIGYMDEDGFITISGRIKRMILIWKDGVCHKVFPKMLEEKFLENKSIKAISIVSREKDERNELIAFVVPEEDVLYEDILENMKGYAKERFEEYECPSEYIIKDKLPLTTIGKVDYRVLEREAGKML